MKSHDLGLTIDNNLITQFSFGLHNRWCNIDFIQNEEFDLIKKICGNRNKNKLFMFEILNLIINMEKISLKKY